MGEHVPEAFVSCLAECEFRVAECRELGVCALGDVFVPQAVDVSLYVLVGDVESTFE